MYYLQMPLMEVPKDLPVILPQEEMQKLLCVSENPKRTTWLLLAYDSGVRVSEIASLLASDIDSKETLFFVKDKKSKRDQYTILLRRLLLALALKDNFCAKRQNWKVRFIRG